MLKLIGNKIQMVKGDFGLPLPIPIPEQNIASDEEIKFIIEESNGKEILVKKYSNITNNQFELSFTKEESEKLKAKTYLYKIDWYKEEVFKGNIVRDEIFEVLGNNEEYEEEELILNLQIKTAIPTKEQQSITYDEEYDALGEVVIEPIPKEYIKPEGTLEITANGKYDVAEKEKVDVNVSIDEYIVTGKTTGNSIINRIVKLPMIDLSGYYNANKLCYGLVSITEIPEWDTSTISEIREGFSDCTNLEKVPLLDFSKIDIITYLFSRCTKLTTLGGFKNLGKNYSTSRSANYPNYGLDLSSCTLLTHDSLMNVINNLYDIKSKGCNVQDLKLGSTNLAKLTEEEIAIATNKGWVVS
jgi:hypothetical protein